MKSLILVFCTAITLGFVSNACATQVALGTPRIFAPGVVSSPANDGSPTFSPDGNTLFFARFGAGGSTIMESHRVHGHWTQPVIAPFSGDWPEVAPEMSPDGSYMIFVSFRRPADAPPGKPVHAVVHLWRVDRVDSGWDHWSKPRELPPAVNISNAVWKGSIAADGSIYFLSIDPGKGKGKRLYVSHFVHGKYKPAQPLPFSHYGDDDVDPEIAPDGSFMVFSSDRRLKGDSKDHLCIVFSKGDGWGTPQPIRYAGDDARGYSSDFQPHLAPDRHTLYFVSDRTMKVAHYPHSSAQAQAYLERVEAWDNGNNNAWSVSLAPLLKAGRATG